MDERLDHAPCGFLSFLDDGTVVEVNQTLLLLLGVEREELLHRPLAAILTVGSRVFSQTHLLPMLRLHGRIDEIFLLLRARDGSDVGVLANAVRRERGGEMRTDCVVVQARERRRYEEELLQSKKAAEVANEALKHERERLRLANEALVQRTVELNRQRMIAEDANRAKSGFLAFMSHELRTPLTAILGYAQLLQFATLEEDDEESVGQILAAGQYLLSLINDVLDLSAVEADRLHLQLEPVAVGDVVRDSFALIRLAAEDRGIRLGHHAPPLGGSTVLADPRRLRQVLLNLLSNAVKYNREVGRIDVSWEAATDGSLRISVADTGPGIAAGHRDRLFTPFDRLEADRGPAAGTGLGLALTRKLVEAMHGRIGVDTLPGHGSTFWIELPRAPATEVATPTAQRVAAPADGPAAWAGRR